MRLDLDAARSNLEAAFARGNAHREQLWTRAAALVRKWDDERQQREHRAHAAAELPIGETHASDL